MIYFMDAASQLFAFQRIMVPYVVTLIIDSSRQFFFSEYQCIKGIQNMFKSYTGLSVFPTE